MIETPPPSSSRKRPPEMMNPSVYPLATVRSLMVSFIEKVSPGSRIVPLSRRAACPTLLVAVRGGGEALPEARELLVMFSALASAVVKSGCGDGRGDGRPTGLAVGSGRTANTAVARSSESILPAGDRAHHDGSSVLDVDRGVAALLLDVGQLVGQPLVQGLAVEGARERGAVRRERQRARRCRRRFDLRALLVHHERHRQGDGGLGQLGEDPLRLVVGDLRRHRRHGQHQGLGLGGEVGRGDHLDGRRGPPGACPGPKA